jgi:hypothetical protein
MAPRIAPAPIENDATSYFRTMAPYRDLQTSFAKANLGSKNHGLRVLVRAFAGDPEISNANPH